MCFLCVVRVFVMFLFYQFLEIHIDVSVVLEVPEGDGAQLVVIVPVVEELRDAVLPSLIFGCLCIGKLKGADGAYLESLHIGVVTPLCNGVGLFGYAELLLLIVELLSEHEEILLELL